MMPISSHLSNLPNQVICGVMWLLHWIPHQPKYFCPLYKHIYRYILPYLASQLPAPGYCCEHHDVPCESTQVTSWCYYKDASGKRYRNGFGCKTQKVCLPLWFSSGALNWWRYKQRQRLFSIHCELLYRYTNSCWSHSHQCWYVRGVIYSYNLSSVAGNEHI